MKIIDKIKLKLLSIKASPEKISRGYALGVFLGTTPFIGTKVVLALCITSLFKWSKAASVIGVYHINILTAPFFYSISFYIGRLATGCDNNLVIPDKMNSHAVLSTFYGSWEILFSFLIGGLILGIPLAGISYYLSYRFLLLKH